MKTIAQVLQLFILIQSIAADRCDELNDRATALQNGDSCILFNTIIDDGDIFAGDMNEVDLTCGVHLENVDHVNCVEEVVDVVADIINEGCEVTGGTSVAKFIYSINDNNETFALLSDLACKQQGECYADLQSAIENCNENPADEYCIDYATCECLMDFVSVMETLSEDAKGDFLKLDTAIIDKIEGSDCRCEELDSLALSLEFGPSCALSSMIVRDGDMLAGDAFALDDTCNTNESTTCVEDVVNVVQGFIEYGCSVANSNAAFIYGLHDFKGDFNLVTDFACNKNGCYSEVKAVVESCNTTAAINCIESTRTECLDAFINVVEQLSDDGKEDLVGTDSSLLLDILDADDVTTTTSTQPGTTTIAVSSTASEAPDTTVMTRAPGPDVTITAATEMATTATVGASKATEASTTSTAATSKEILTTNAPTGPVEAETTAPPQDDAAGASTASSAFINSTTMTMFATIISWLLSAVM